MPTVIDELVVTLGLDPTKFTDGQKKALEAFGKTKEAARQSGKQVEKGATDMSAAFATLQGRLLGIASIFLGGMGLKEFAEHITKITSQTGYLSKQLGVSAQELSQWQGAGARVGATADDIASSIRGMVGALAEGQLHGTSSIQKYFMAMGISPIDPKTGRWKTPTQIYMEMSRWAQTQDPRLATQLFREMGQSPGMINLLLQGPEKLQKYLEAQKKLAPSDEDIAKLQHLQSVWNKLAQDSEALARTIFISVVPAIEKTIEWLDNMSNSMAKHFHFMGKSWEERDKIIHDKAGVSQASPGSGTLGIGDVWGNIKRGFSGKAPPEQPPPASGIPAPNPAGVSTAPTTPTPAAAAPAPGSSRQAPARGTRTGWWTPERKQYAVNYLMKNAGLPELGARALVSRWANVEASRGPGEINSIGATGIAQWLGRRKAGVVPGDFEGQLAHAARELNTSERRAATMLKNARTEQEAAIGASQFERAEGYNPSTGADNYVAKTVRGMRGIPGATRPQMDDDAFARGTDRVPFITPHPGLMALQGPGNVSHNNTTSSTSINNLIVNSNSDDPRQHAADVASTLRANTWMNQGNMGPN